MSKNLQILCITLLGGIFVLQLLILLSMHKPMPRFIKADDCPINAEGYPDCNLLMDADRINEGEVNIHDWVDGCGPGAITCMEGGPGMFEP